MSTDVLSALRDKRESLSKSQRRICDHILANYEKAAFLTASKLGEYSGVSESTVVRFAVEMGFDGYPDFQAKLRQLVKNKLTSVQRVDISSDRMSDLPSDILQSDIENIKSTIDSIDVKSFNRAVDRIIASKRIFIIGVRSCSGLASFFAYYLDMLFDNVKLLHTTSGSEIFEQLYSIGSEDILIAVSYPRYSKRIIDAVRFAKSKNANVVSITDNISAPIAEFSDELLIAKSDISSFVDSLVSPLSVINALIVAIGNRKKDELTVKLENLERIWDEYDVYQKSQQ